MDRSALASGALRLLTGGFSRQKQSPQPSLSNARLQVAQHRLARSWRNRRTLRRALRIATVVVTLATISISVLLIRSYRAYARLVDDRLAHGYLSSRAGIYAAPRTLRPGQKITRDGLAALLRRAGYVESDAVSEV